MFSLLFLSSCTEREKMYKESRTLMDTFCTITVISPSREEAIEAVDAGFAEIKKLETLLNYFSDQSEISTVNRAAGSMPVEVSIETLEILKKSLDISKAANGAFDPTIAPVIKQWSFSKDSSVPVIPSGKVIEHSLALVDYKKIKINAETREVYLEDKGMELDLGGITKGFAADKAVDAIKNKGVTAALVAVAGDIRGFGLNISGQGWKVGIQNPRTRAGSDKPWEDIFAVLRLKDKAISTSGDYQRFFIKDGVRFHHILDPQTGYPSESGLISVSVIAPEGYLADGISTAVFVLGAEKGLTILESMGLDGILVNNNRKVFITKNLKGKIDILNKEYQKAE
jgi:thiamine biosynthesis lipoprotein